LKTDATLRATLLDRLSAVPQGEAWDALVLAALEGPMTLGESLDAAPAEKKPLAKAEPAPPPKAAYLKSLAVEGFRGIGKKTALELTPGPGLTLVVGRNGSGKSSFAEALELLLTGDTYRWSKRTKVWREGWRNLHSKPASIEAQCLIEGKKGAAVLKRAWADEQPLEAGLSSLQILGEAKTDASALGWSDALKTYRPFLSYNELGSLLDDGPSKLFDALAQILGLDELVDAQSALGEERKNRDKAQKEADAQRLLLVDLLKTKDDPRAKALLEVVEKKQWNAVDAEKVLAGDDPSPAQAEVDQLKRLASLHAPAEDQVAAAAQALRDAEAKQKASAGSLAQRSKDIAELLEAAIRFHDNHGDADCPVCGQKKALDKKWRKHQAEEAKALRDKAKDATAAQSQLDAAKAQVQKLQSLDLPKAVPALAEEWNAAKAALETWKTTDDLEKNLAGLTKALDHLRTQAEAELKQREDAWRPVRDIARDWLAKAKDARRKAEPIKDLKAAEAWLKQATDEIRAERFLPIKDKAQNVWNLLRMQSNVALEDIKLTGTATTRKVDLKVTVDGVPGAALGVMSQGELHALALALFIPRATLAESPFRFIVIDDPVQSMDPARVDGLARVLDEAAKDRQVIVFTHDDRLPEAVRRLQVGATVIEVTRREQSQVELREGKNPVSRYIEDAAALAWTENLPSPAKRRVIPGFCRLAIEAACTEVIRKKRLAKGIAHAEVEAALEEVHGTTQLAALALFDDKDRGSDVLSRLNKERRDYADAFKTCQSGSHEVIDFDTAALVKGTENLTKWLRAQS